MAREVEVKFHVSDRSVLRKQILDIHPSVGTKTFEKNFRFDSEDNRLMETNCLLRVRESDNHTTLTYKWPSGELQSQFKILEELEVTVSNAEVMKQILEAVGFHVVQSYEKYRETFYMDSVILCLDTMPYGEFLEIEGKETEIRHIGELLGFAWEDRILANYLEIFEVIKIELGLSFSNLTFGNFKGVATNFSQFKNRFVAGSD